MKTVQEFRSQDGTRKVEIFQREDCTFGFTDWQYDAKEDLWYP